MEFLKSNLGKRLSAIEVAEYLGLDIETVRRHHKSLGGIRLGRRILFFENLIVEAIREVCHAIQEEEKEKSRMGWRGNAPGETVLQGIPDEIRSIRLGIGNQKRTHRKISDPYGVLEAD
jgi:hypothetical protein